VNLKQTRLPDGQVSPTIWELSKDFKPGMRVPGKVMANKKLLKTIEDKVLDQLANTAFLPGVVEAVWAMPDAHIGFGVPIGCVFATDPEKEGIISPGAIGFDINCGIRLITTNLTKEKLEPKTTQLIDALFKIAGAGLGAKSNLKLTQKEVEAVCCQGIQWAVKKGFGRKKDLNFCEEKGRLAGADPQFISQRALQRGRQQLGTLGSGNHYLEIQEVTKIFDSQKGKKLGINQEGQITIMIHCGSRGLGHQIASDYIRQFGQAMKKYQIELPNRQLACAPFNSPEGKAYYSAMAGAVNYAFANRQILTDKVRKTISNVFQTKEENLGLDLVYDVAHNVAKLESGLLVHRKGATRAFGPNHPVLPEKYQKIGQPVIIGGSMETASYLLLGTKRAEELTFGSTCHGAGRVMSRKQARKQTQGMNLQQDLEKKGIQVRTASYSGLAEEAGIAYKDIDLVVQTVVESGISIPIVKFKPLANIKG